MEIPVIPHPWVQARLHSRPSLGGRIVSACFSATPHDAKIESGPGTARQLKFSSLHSGRTEVSRHVAPSADSLVRT